jgi:Na+:H+ antiporter, NhaA family
MHAFSTVTSMPINAIRDFLRLESASGILLIGAAVAALLIANSPLAWLYNTFLQLRVTVSIEDIGVAKPLYLWINDGLMAVFFLLIGLEIKREVLEGELRSPAQIVLPACAAMGGFAVPGAIYAWLNWHDPVALAGWAIPAATDIAFALGVLSMLGSRVPVALKLFLTSLAIFDDIAAIVVIAVFYTANLSLLSLVLALVGVLALLLLNRLGVVRLAPYILIGIFIWACVLKSGVHATLAGFVVALTIPLQRSDGAGESPLQHLEHSLHPWVAYMILPLFAFANAGVSFAGATAAEMTGGVATGIAVALFFGKQLGIFATSAALIRCGFAALPHGATWTTLYGVALLGGIGFTMSLFIGTLAFEHAPIDYDAPVRAAVLAGSVLSACAGYLVLRFALEPDASA